MGGRNLCDHFGESLQALVMLVQCVSSTKVCFLLFRFMERKKIIHVKKQINDKKVFVA